jgi:hypothetical protein
MVSYSRNWGEDTVWLAKVFAPDSIFARDKWGKGLKFRPLPQAPFSC